MNGFLYHFPNLGSSQKKHDENLVFTHFIYNMGIPKSFLRMLQREKITTIGWRLISVTRRQTGTPNENIVQNHLNITLLNVF